MDTLFVGYVPAQMRIVPPAGVPATAAASVVNRQPTGHTSHPEVHVPFVAQAVAPMGQQPLLQVMRGLGQMHEPVRHSPVPPLANGHVPPVRPRGWQAPSAQARSWQTPTAGQVPGSLLQQRVLAMQVPLQQICSDAQSAAPSQRHRPLAVQTVVPSGQQTGRSSAFSQQMVAQPGPSSPKTGA
jgi:hypothetical protein